MQVCFLINSITTGAYDYGECLGSKQRPVIPSYLSSKCVVICVADTIDDYHFFFFLRRPRRTYCAPSWFIGKFIYLAHCNGDILFAIKIVESGKSRWRWWSAKYIYITCEGQNLMSVQMEIVNTGCTRCWTESYRRIICYVYCYLTHREMVNCSVIIMPSLSICHKLSIYKLPLSIIS